MKEEDWIKTLRKELEGYREEPPTGMLDEIKQQMHAKGVGIDKEPTLKGNRKWLPWMGYAAAAGITLWLLVVPLTNLSDSSDELADFYELSERRNVTNDSPLTEIKDINIENTGTKKLTAAKEANTTSINTEKSSTKATILKAKAVNISGTTEAATTTGETALGATAEVVRDISPASTDQESITRKEPNTEKKPNTQTAPSEATYASSSQRQKGKLSRVLSEVFFGNLLSNEQRGSGRMLLAEANPLGEHKESLGGGRSPQTMAGSGEMKTKAKHKQPVQWGASIRFGLAPRWTLQTGLTYTYLSSDITREQGAMRYEVSQGLHFIGIPVAVSYEVWKHGKWRAYVSGGGQVERMVKGKANTDCFIKGEKQATTHEHIKDHHLQFSANLSAGIAYRLLPWMSAYAEPGASYYFDNGSAVKSRYTDQPWNANFKFGFRLHFGE